MIDWDRVESLRDEVGAEAFDEVAELFLDEVDPVISRLETSPDPACLEQDLHFLKGSALNLGFADFGALCQEGERLAASGEAGKINVMALVELYRKSRDAFLAARAPGLRATG
jgi:histidine phosphotransfer protein HptB